MAPVAEPISWHVELALKPGALESFRALTGEPVLSPVNLDFLSGPRCLVPTPNAPERPASLRRPLRMLPPSTA